MNNENSKMCKKIDDTFSSLEESGRMSFIEVIGESDYGKNAVAHTYRKKNKGCILFNPNIVKHSLELGKLKISEHIPNLVDTSTLIVDGITSIDELDLTVLTLDLLINRKRVIWLGKTASGIDFPFGIQPEIIVLDEKPARLTH